MPFLVVLKDHERRKKKKKLLLKSVYFFFIDAQIIKEGIDPWEDPLAYGEKVCAVLFIKCL